MFKQMLYVLPKAKDTCIDTSRITGPGVQIILGIGGPLCMIGPPSEGFSWPALTQLEIFAL